MLDKLKKSIDNAFNAAAKTYDETIKVVPEWMPVSAMGIFVVELCKEVVGRKNQPKQP
jgi:hypothetical protein